MPYSDINAFDYLPESSALAQEYASGGRVATLASRLRAAELRAELPGVSRMLGADWQAIAGPTLQSAPQLANITAAAMLPPGPPVPALTGAVAGAAGVSLLPRIIAALGLGGAGLDAVTEGGLFDLPLGPDVLPGPGVFRVPWGGGGGPPDQTDPVAYSWNTGTAQFYRLASGKIAVQRKNGMWKVYRPKKHIVISTNPRMSAVRKLEKTHKRVIRDLAKASVDLVLKSSRRAK